MIEKQRLVLLGLLLCLGIAETHAQHWQKKPTLIETRWAKDVDPTNVLPEYPRPQMVRAEWENLNGLWQYAITSNTVKKPYTYQGDILVPYPIESALSGVMKSLQPDQLLWYKRKIERPAIRSGERVLLHFGAIDWHATIYINGKYIGEHKGGYQNFSFDVTSALRTGTNEVLIKVYDPSNKGVNPCGKQLLFASGSGTSYTPSSGIWQTVWMEKVPAQYISGIVITPDVDRSTVNITVRSKVNAAIQLQADGKTLNGKTNTEITVPINNVKLWSPDDPYLYNLKISLGQDVVQSYFGMRKIEVKKDDKGIERIFLNNVYTYNLGVLDQGFWPEGLHTAPTDAALKFDIAAAKAMGFNTIRKHIKIEPARWYYHCDKLGMMVWQDMVQPGNDSKEAKAEFEKETKENLLQLHNYPSITTWVLFNEGWGTYDQARLTKWVKQSDPSRIVNGHSGENYYNASPLEDSLKWANSDLTDIHHYSEPEMPPSLPGKAMVLGEFGGIGDFSIEDHAFNDAVWSYAYVRIPASAMSTEYRKLINTLKELEEKGLSGSIYTQPYDVEGEHNGLLTYDRKIIKLPIDELKQINALLIPAAKNYIEATKDFSAAVVDTANIDKEYPDRLSAFKSGRRDSLFLRRLALMANRLKDNENASLVSAEYIRQMKDPFSLNNLRFIKFFTKRTTDPAFQFLFKNEKAVNRILGDDQASKTLKIVIFGQELKKYAVDKNGKPDWDKLHKEITAKYGQLGEEMVWYAQAKHALFTKDWNNTFFLVKQLMQKYGKSVSAGDLNAYAWGMFEQVSDRKLLTEALSWSRKSIELDNEPRFKDTYANLLYKLGYGKEAIVWQEKAVAALPNDSELLKSLEKMKKGEPTWVLDTDSVH